MGRFSDRTKKVSNAEIEAVCDEFIAKLETLRIRYEQYFIGVEKKAPTALRMDVARLLNDLESVFVNNTALKFKIQSSIQKFTSYSTYWNRTLREIEDGTYKRHLDRVKRQSTVEIAQPQSARVSSTSKNEAANPAISQAVADEAEAYLASLGLSSGSNQAVAQPPRPPVVAPQPPSRLPNTPPHPAVVQPAVVRPAVVQPAARRPSVVQPAVTRPPVIQPAVVQPAAKRPSVAQPAVTRPAVVQPASRPPVIQPAADRTSPSMPAVPKPPVIQPAADRTSPSLPPVPKGIIPPKK